MNLKNIFCTITLFAGYASAGLAQEPSFDQSLDQLWAEYKKKSELLNPTLEQLSFTSKEDFERACTEYSELTQILNYIIAYAIDNGEYKGSLKIVLDEHKDALMKNMQNHLNALALYTMDREKRVKDVAAELKSLKESEKFYASMYGISGILFLASGAYIALTSDSNATLDQVNGAALTSLIASAASSFVFFVCHGLNSDAQASVRNYIRMLKLGKAKELEGWEKKSYEA